jgi:hypothetical protein
MSGRLKVGHSPDYPSVAVEIEATGPSGRTYEGTLWIARHHLSATNDSLTLAAEAMARTSEWLAEEGWTVERVRPAPPRWSRP